jgi:2-phosphosulfolactate phosphatase
VVIDADAAQREYAYRFEWGLDGLDAVVADAAVLVVVDVLRFSTVVDIAVSRGAAVVPVVTGDPASDAAGDVIGLSPAGLAPVLAGRTVRLRSDNGAALAVRAAEWHRRQGVTVVAGSLRNATAVAAAARRIRPEGPVAVVAAGERWPGGALRPGVEDLLGAGAVLAALDPSGSVSAPRCSPEAAAARAAFTGARYRLRDAVAGSASARELLRRGRNGDLDWAAALDVSPAVPLWSDGAFRLLR